MNEQRLVVEYDDAGRIRQSSILQKSVVDRRIMSSPHFLLILPVDRGLMSPDEWYVDGDRELAKRQPMSTQQSISEGELILSGLPDPCEVRVLDEAETVTGGSLTITFDEPGRYLVEIRGAVAYLDHVLEVDIP